MPGIEQITLNRVVFGIRYENHFRIEDAFGEIVDDILSTDTHGPDRFHNIGYAAGARQLLSEDRAETITFNRNDTIYENTNPKRSIDGLQNMAGQFVDVVWNAVLKNTKTPSINRCGCLVGFDLPDDWDPIKTMLDTESNEFAEFDLRFSRRLLVDKALAMRDVNDFRNVIYEVNRKAGKSTAFIDFQHYYNPTLDEDKWRKENPYTRFVEHATNFFQKTGWDFLRTRIERLPNAA